MSMLRALTVFLICASPFPAEAEPDLDCRVRLNFLSDQSGSVASYMLTLQIKNTAGREVRGLSVNYFDNEMKPLGNVEMFCPGSNGDGIIVGSYGECSAQLQKVDGDLLNKFGAEIWTSIVNTQLQSLDSIRKCELLGFVY